MMERIEVSTIMSAPLEQVSALFWDIRRWYEVWQPIEQVTVPYDDGCNQEFHMTVWRNNQPEQIRTIRFRRTSGKIDFFSPVSPPMMSLHRGSWLFTSEQKGCRVVAVREYLMRQLPGEDQSLFAARCEEFRAGFIVRLEALLGRFNQHFTQIATTSRG